MRTFQITSSTYGTQAESGQNLGTKSSKVKKSAGLIAAGLIGALVMGVLFFSFFSILLSLPAAETLSYKPNQAKGNNATVTGNNVKHSTVDSEKPETDARGIADYQIEAELLTKERMIRGQLELDWRNTTAHPVNRLAFHLYMNAFKHQDTLFMRESQGYHRGNTLGPGDWGSIDVEHIMVDGLNVTPNIRIAGCLDPPCGESAQHDETVMTVKLDQPIKAKTRAKIRIRFSTRLPKIFARTGYSDNFYMIAQWFPKIGVLEKESWRCHAFHATSEFYANFGDYKVWMNLPADFVVGSTGKRLKTKIDKKRKNRRVHFFHAKDVHDFALATGPSLVRESKVWNNIEFTLLAPKSLYKQSLPHLDLTIKSLKKLEPVLGPYPYDHLTIVVPPEKASGAGGMEYPTLFTTFVSRRGFPGILDEEQTTVHELIHQYFQGMLASDEGREPWLDEGLTTYTTGIIMDNLYGKNSSFMSLWGFDVGYYPMMRLCMKHRPDWDPINTASWDYATMSTYGVTTYCKATMLLKSLEGLIGRQKMNALLYTYVSRYRFRHPSTEDFLNVVEGIAGSSVSELVAKALSDTSALDHRVVSISNRRYSWWERIAAADKDKERKLNKETEPTKDIEPTKETEPTKDIEPKPISYLSTIKLHRRGSLAWPVDIVIHLEDSTRIRRVWRDDKKWKIIKLELNSKVTQVQLDPDRKVWLDACRLNDGLKVKSTGAPARATAMRFGLVLQWMLKTIGF